MGRIIVVGGINMDLHLFGVRSSAGQAPLTAEHYLTEPGGKGANVARAAARLGAGVALVGRVGDDEYGRRCVAAVRDDGVDTSAVRTTAGEPTGFVAIELVDGRHRSLLFVPGANEALTWADVEPALAGAGPGDVIVAQAEVPPPALERLAEAAARVGAPLFLDPTPPDRVAPAVVRAADVITPNLSEAARLVGRGEGSRLVAGIVARELVDAGARRVLVKAAEAGAVLAERGRSLEVATLPVDAVDETGAGDVFLAALAVERVRGADWERASRFANVASALSVAASGLHLPTRDAVERELHALDGRDGPVRGPSPGDAVAADGHRPAGSSIGRPRFRVGGAIARPAP
ncbi:MAG: PfkB family carbohydrate kinase [Actinomycetota bacterium]|nr:PfkB family carbohydrate kinase [Actinomycetota bacterium]